MEKQQLVEWFANNYKNFGAQLEFVTNRSQEGLQFVKGFGGLGGILRYKVDFMEHDYGERSRPKGGVLASSLVRRPLTRGLRGSVVRRRRGRRRRVLRR